VRRLKNTVESIRKFDTVNFSAVKIAKVCKFNEICCDQTVRRRMEDLGFHYLNTRQKGIMSQDDHKIRVDFAKHCLRVENDKLWLERISFYYDGVAFYHKKDPYSEAIAPNAKVWRQKNEGLKLSRKGKKEGNNGKAVKMFVGIAYGKGVVMCKQWDPEVRWLGVNYRKFVRRTFPEALKCSANPKKKLVLQDGCPVMNSKQGKLGYKSVGCEVFSIPARSPDLNPIENIFNLVR